jgi:hypothetical protein
MTIVWKDQLSHSYDPPSAGSPGTGSPDPIFRESSTHRAVMETRQVNRKLAKRPIIPLAIDGGAEFLYVPAWLLP